MEILNPSQNNPCLAPTQLISTSPTEVVMVKLQISVLFGIFLALPFLAYWIIQRLKRRYEINTVSLALWGVAAFTLFEIGFAFTYFIILPTAYKILVALTTGANIIPLFSINQFMLFTVISLLLFSLSFVLVAAVITADPTPFSQLLLSGPLIFLYEVSILVSGIIRKSEKRVR
jgi:sec-independent protein translocase protein TatC